MSAQHTPGPWRVIDWQYTTAGREHVPTIQTDADAIAEALPLWGESQDREGERLANAALIADAPAMLEALLDIARQLAGSRFKLDVKRDYSLMVADATARKLLDKHGVQP